jgi:trimeric autotransporter adhesin
VALGSGILSPGRAAARRFVAAPVAGAAGSPLLTSLVAYWKLDEASGTRADATGRGNNLTDNNTVTQAAGKVGSAAQFTAANSEYLRVADNADISTGNVDFTLACWLQLATKGARRGAVAKDNNAGAGVEYELEYENTTDRIRWRVRGETLNADVLGSPAAGTWYFVVAWHDSAQAKRFVQVNDGTANSAAQITPPADGAAALDIGRWEAGFYWDGLIDEVGFWKRVLTAAERTTLYNGGAGRTYPFPGT